MLAQQQGPWGVVRHPSVVQSVADSLTPRPDALPFGGDHARHVRPWGRAPGVSSRYGGASVLPPSPRRFCPTVDPLRGRPVRPRQAFRGGLRGHRCTSDCRACDSGTPNHPKNPAIIASRPRIALTFRLVLPRLRRWSALGCTGGWWCAGVVERPEEPVDVPDALRRAVCWNHHLPPLRHVSFRACPLAPRFC